ncbi:MAG: hypothetical protein U0441_28550 [Polyangiaceae bacterium]
MEAQTNTSSFTMAGTDPGLSYDPLSTNVTAGNPMYATNEAVDGRGNPTAVTLYIYFSRYGTSPYVADGSLFDSGANNVVVTWGPDQLVGRIASTARTDGDYAMWAYNTPPALQNLEMGGNGSGTGGGRNVKVHVGS